MDLAGWIMMFYMVGIVLYIFFKLLKLFGIDILKENLTLESDEKKTRIHKSYKKTNKKNKIIEKVEEEIKIPEPYHPIGTTWAEHVKILEGTNDISNENDYYPKIKIKKIIDPNNPWGKLRKQVLIRDKYTCQGYNCNKKERLNVHHIVPVSLGGKNKLTNLVTLCIECHQKTHNSNFTSHKNKDDMKNYGEDVQLSKKINLLADAIEKGQDVQIDYIDFDKKISHRTIKPNNIAYGDHNLKIYVFAYCYMRNALRTFRISKINKLEVVK